MLEWKANKNKMNIQLSDEKQEVFFAVKSVKSVFSYCYIIFLSELQLRRTNANEAVLTFRGKLAII